ncbi:Trypanosomal VSG domain containing protein, putative [Trypanosoma equiperdum]|uniref:Trypanosomal VSG domain containing protein, putative n=1 Tax=Trypanosoma equiperdum TaxID=5694 RepID=A0A1G4IFV0_TRYEQ|nr:Trypanosomal VSG domain containing protein, putative [Trypanosoma equiperdum]
MVCLCVNGHSSGNQYCTAEQTAGDDYSGSTATKGTALGTFNKLATACSAGEEGRAPELSGATLAQAVTALKANFGTNWVSQAGLGDANGNGGEKSGIL